MHRQREVLLHLAQQQRQSFYDAVQNLAERSTGTGKQLECDWLELVT